MPTAFRITARRVDDTGRFRTSILLTGDTCGDWSGAAKAEFARGYPLPCTPLDLTRAEYENLDKCDWLRFGYVDTAGDTTTPFTPEAWR